MNKMANDAKSGHMFMLKTTSNFQEWEKALYAKASPRAWLPGCTTQALRPTL
jgi:hypothetical protein